jgi:predicted GNAT family N-acyltransferase
MHKLIVRAAITSEEQDLAFRLALRVFTVQTNMENYAEYKSFVWEADPSFNRKNVLLAYVEEELVGLIRLVPRIVYRGKETFSVAGISSVCIAPEWQGKGLSTALMHQTLAICRSRNYDISFLFARRVADHYYTRFGFYGIASYSKIFIKKPEHSQSVKRFSLAAADDSLCQLYQTVYEKSYQNCFGRIDRSQAYWKFLLTSISKRKDISFHTVYFDNTAVGYVLAGETKIVEIAVNDTVPGTELMYFLMSENLVTCLDNTLEIDILPQHALINFFGGMDIRFQYRECRYGGHMAKIINTEKMISKLGKRSPVLAKELAGSVHNEILSYAETCSLLGVYSPTALDNRDMKNDCLPFDICSADHF